MIKPRQNKCRFCGKPLPKQEVKESLLLTGIKRLPSRADVAPLGWEVETRSRDTKVTKFQHAYPTIRLPFQEVQRFEFGHNDKFLAENEKNPAKAGRDLFPTGANRLFFGDNLHVMRQLPSESIDLIYIDPPFFSGRNYNIIFGDKNEMRSFSDIWEDGMPGYLVWLNARLWEMKRLLKPTGSIYVHLDWHASHYVKVEMDKIFGVDNFQNEIVWSYTSGGVSKQWFGRKHDAILAYCRKLGHHYINLPQEKSYTATLPEPHTPSGRRLGVLRDKVCDLCGAGTPGQKHRMVTMRDVWTDLRSLFRNDEEMIGYPTQKPERLLERIIRSSCPEDGAVADFFCGGGTTPAVAQRLNRRWIACDQSRIAVAITADRLAKVVEEKIGTLFPVPDFTVEHWGIYEAPKLEQ